MRYMLSLIFIIACYWGSLSAFPSKIAINNCDVTCNQDNGNLSQCNCRHDSSSVPERRKRDTVQDLLKKAHRKIQITTKKPKTLIFPNHSRKAVLLPKHQLPIYHKDFQERLKDFKARMASGRPLIKARANIEPDDKTNLIEQFKTKQEELIEKFRKANGKPAHKTGIGRQNLHSRIDIGSSKLGLVHKAQENVASTSSSTTTQAPESSSLIVKMSPTTDQPAKLLNDIGSNNNEADAKEGKTNVAPKVIKRMKEKQKETLTNMKDKIGLSKRQKQENAE
ncbi:uncharacterized protein [Euwallacea fornicatus]|uniref:uncharacterized protein n=1 Tax=Euwallacea fornicatus TaxID=995702 RepID=UPI0033903571